MPETPEQMKARKAKTAIATQKRRIYDARKRAAKFYAERQIYAGLTKDARVYLGEKIFRKRIEQEKENERVQDNHDK